jgi:hypothetical protein
MIYLLRFAHWLYSQLLRLYPRRFRAEFTEEMTAVFRQNVQAAGDLRDTLAVLGRELRDWPMSCLREHVQERNRQLLLPQSSFLSGWSAGAAALPFLLFFLLYLSPVVSPPFMRILLPVLLFGGLVAAWWQRWPGWVAGWLGFLIIFGQNWLPYSLLSDEPAWNTASRLLNMLSEVVIQTGWLAAMYWVVRRWPRHGTLVFLPFLMLPWAFSMEFASEAMTAVVFGAAFLVLALTAVAISIQRTTSGDIWLMYGAALLPGVLLSLGAVFFSPGMENAWLSIGPNLMQALAPFAGILLVQSLNAWSRENGRSAQRYARQMTFGTVLAFMALLALRRVILPSDLEAFRASVAPVLATVWLLGVLLVLLGGWGLKSHFAPPGRRHIAVATVMLALLPLLNYPPFLFLIANGLTYGNPKLSAMRDLLPVLQTADSVLLIAGFGGLLLLPWVIGWLRQQTAAFPASPTPPTPAGLKNWRQRRRERREASGRPESGWPRPRRLALLLTPGVLLAGGFFFVTGFLPLQLEAEPYTQQVALGDLDGDGDLDAVLANTMRLLPNADNRILYNDGSGLFNDMGHTVGAGGTSVVVLDSDADGDLDVLIGGMVGVGEFRNDGDGRFSRNNMAVSQTPESGASQFYLQAGDLNDDGVADAFMAGCCGIGVSEGEGEMRWVAPVNRVLLGSDAGLVDSGQQLGERGSQAVDLGDVDGDGDLDAFVGNSQSNSEPFSNDEPNEVWLNDGNGIFSDSGQLLGRQRTYAVALGDVDGDGDVDALVGNEGADELWLNDGRGRFTLSEQSWNKRRTLAVFLSDLDGDGDLDALTGHQVASRFAWWRQGLVWWNDGSGRFTQGEQHIRFRPNAALAVGDANRDGMPDIISGALDEVTVWLNDGNGRFQMVP